MDQRFVAVMTAVVALVWRTRTTALVVGAGALPSAGWGFAVTVDGLITAVSGLPAAWQWWAAHRLPLWPGPLYRAIRRGGYARVPAFRAGVPVGGEVPVELIEPDLRARNS